MSYLYFLYSDKDQRWYSSCTDLSLKDQFNAHRTGKVSATRNRRPLRLAYFEEIDTYKHARKREGFINHAGAAQEKKLLLQTLLEQQELWPIEGPMI